jgi:phage gp46-like protein
VESFDTAILVSLFSDKRADPSEVLESQNRRGWWGNAFYQDTDDKEMGSKLWLLEQARLTQDTANRAQDYVRDALSWLVEGGYLKNILVETEIIDKSLYCNITFIRDGSISESKSFLLWEQSGDIN